METSRWPGVLVCVTLAAGPGFGQSASTDTAGDAGAEAPRPVFYETTTVVARPVSSASGSVSVIGAAEIEASGARSVGELLREVAGLNVVGSGGRGGVTFARLRGGDPNFTLVLLDGIPLNDPTETQGGAVNLEELSTRFVDRVEVVRGPLGSFYGVSSLAGVVQMFTRRGAPGPVRVGLRAEAGNASLLDGAATVSGPAGRGGYSGGVSWSREERRVGDDRFRQLEAHAGASLGLGTARDLRLSARFVSGQADDYPDGSGGPIFGSGRLRHSEHHDVALGAELETGDPDGRRQRFAIGFSRRRQDRSSPAVPPLVPDSDEDTTFSRLRLAWQVPFHHTPRTALDLGFSGEGEWGDNTSLLRLPPEFGGDVPGDYHKARASAGGYVELRHQRGPALYELALRADAATTDALQLNPRLGVVWRLREGATRVRVSGGRASKLPSFFALASPAALGGNPDLRPERTLGGEAGLDHSWRAARLDLGATLFLHEYRDLVDFAFDAFTHVNRSRVRAKGAELSLAWRPRTALELEAAATWLDARDPSGAALRQRPRWSGSGRLTWQPAAGLGLRVEARGVSRYLDQQIPAPERDSVAGHALFASSAWWRLRPRWTLRARVDNLAGRFYETYIGFPGPKRSFWAGLAWERP